MFYHTAKLFLRLRFGIFAHIQNSHRIRFETDIEPFQRWIWTELRKCEIGDVLLSELDHPNIFIDIEFLDIEQSNFHPTDGHCSAFLNLNADLLHIILTELTFERDFKSLPMASCSLQCKLDLSIWDDLSTENAISPLCDSEVDFSLMNQKSIDLWGYLFAR
jgi:hypothetical protein